MKKKKKKKRTLSKNWDIHIKSEQIKMNIDVLSKIRANIFIKIELIRVTTKS